MSSLWTITVSWPLLQEITSFCLENTVFCDEKQCRPVWINFQYLVYMYLKREVNKSSIENTLRRRGILFGREQWKWSVSLMWNVLSTLILIHYESKIYHSSICCGPFWQRLFTSSTVQRPGKKNKKKALTNLVSTWTAVRKILYYINCSPAGETQRNHCGQSQQKKRTDENKKGQNTAGAMRRKTRNWPAVQSAGKQTTDAKRGKTSNRCQARFMKYVNSDYFRKNTRWHFVHSVQQNSRQTCTNLPWTYWLLRIQILLLVFHCE